MTTREKEGMKIFINDLIDSLSQSVIYLNEAALGLMVDDETMYNYARLKFSGTISKVDRIATEMEIFRRQLQEEAKEQSCDCPNEVYVGHHPTCPNNQ